MPKVLGLRDSFAIFGAKLKNVQWSVSAWTPADELVLSLWAHHYRKGPESTALYADSAARWHGHGRDEFVANVDRAFREKRPVRLVVVSTTRPDLVQSGVDASKVPKSFDARPDLIGDIAEWDGENYVVRFRRAVG